MSEPGTLLYDITHHRFFVGIPPAMAVTLASMADRSHHVAGAVIFDEGGEATDFLLVTKGTVRLTMHVPGRGDVTIETVGAGDVIGWSWAVPPHRWAFRAVAGTAVELVHIHGAALRRSCEQDHELGYRVHSRLVAVLGDRLRHTRLRVLDIYGQR